MDGIELGEWAMTYHAGQCGLVGANTLTQRLKLTYFGGKEVKLGQLKHHELLPKPSLAQLRATGVGCHIGGRCVNSLSYADDMVLLAPSIKSFRRLVSVCEQYAITHGLSYNVSKTELMVFRAGKGPENIPDVFLNGVALRVVSEFKYLGHILAENGNDDLDIERERRALSFRCNMLARKFGKCNDEVKMTLFNSYCQSLYTCQLWPRYCSASSMFAKARIADFFAVIRGRIASFWQKINNSCNGVIKGVVETLNNPVFKHWISVHRSVFILKASNKVKKEYRAICGGSIIREDRVLSSAHCFYTNRKRFKHKWNSLKVVGGLLTTYATQPVDDDEAVQQWRNIDKIYTQKYFRFPAYNLAVVQLEKPWNFNQFIDKIAYASLNLDFDGVCIVTAVRMARSWSSQKFLFKEVFNMLPRMKCESTFMRDCRLYYCTEFDRRKLLLQSVETEGSALICRETGDPKEINSTQGLLVGVTSLIFTYLPTIHHKVGPFNKWVTDAYNCIKCHYNVRSKCFTFRFTNLPPDPISDDYLNVTTLFLKR
ncbi:unnamed protein product [Diatraea saccharalis]|uniref:Peptidase S1 domain-containing protein n=1 Tax=Diatraea saccharalis TaxID=40085 RepID=A0A9N9WES4_9NEOP|nr:unnamed protein product [Diatraea saccharalis]